MKFRLVIAAIVLLALFSLKMGTGLLLHNLFHRSSADVTQDHSKKTEKDLTYACNCIDDFLMPFAESEAQVFTQPAVYQQEYTLTAIYPIFTSAILFNSLRGPPVLVS